MEFYILLAIHLKEGDKIEFYQGDWSNPMSHREYISATVFRKGKEILTLKSLDMQMLTLLREAEEKDE